MLLYAVIGSGTRGAAEFLPGHAMIILQATIDRTVWRAVAHNGKMRRLGVLLCYNDGDLLEESLRYLLEQNHDVVVWDHGSTDETPEVIRRFSGELLETKFVPREFDFYQLYPAMSRHLIDNYTARYDWISWPDQDEFLEGPTRAKSYQESLREVFESRYDWIQFNNFNYWTTNADDSNIPATTARVRHYALFPDCAPSDSLLAKLVHQHSRVQSQPTLGRTVAGALQPASLSDAKPRADDDARLTRSRQPEAWRIQLSLRQHETPPAGAGNRATTASL